MSGCQQALSAEKAVSCPMQGTAFANESHKKIPPVGGTFLRQRVTKRSRMEVNICISPLFRYTFQNPIVVLKHVRFPDCYLVPVIVL